MQPADQGDADGRQAPGADLLVGGCLAVNAAANYVAVAVLDQGIEGAAVATVFSYFVVFVATSGYALNMMIGRRAMIAHVSELVFVAAYVAAVLWRSRASSDRARGRSSPTS